MRNCALLALVCAIICVAGGCEKSGAGSRSGLVKAAGVLKYNGSPVAGATIEMRPVDESITDSLAVALTDEKGAFVFMTDRPGDGAFPGKYRASVTKQTETIEGKPKEEYLKEHDPQGTGEFFYDKSKVVVEDLLPKKYADPLNSPLEIEIPEKGNKNIEINLED